jgi:ABC-type transport system involved in multi-copper enzyme maturation permease subunit
MRALLWKDIRLSRPALTFGFVLFLLPYLAVLALGLSSHLRGGPSWWRYDPALMAGFISLVLSLLTLTILSGNSLAAEREDRSAEFLACLPPSRCMVLKSKAALIGLVCLPVFGLNLITILGIAPRLTGAPAEYIPGVNDNPAVEFLYVTIAAILLVGVAWFCSAWVKRASTAIAAALLALPALAGVVLTALRVFDIPLSWLGPVFRFSAVSLGVAGMAIGTVIFVRRFDP